MKLKKVRKESGREYNKIYDPEIGAYNTQHWNDWNDQRDGARAGNIDRTLKPVKHYSQGHWGYGISYHELKKRKLRLQIQKLLRRRR